LPALQQYNLRPGMYKVAIFGAMLALLGLQTSRSAFDGVFSAPQAERGRSRYEGTCEPCHGADLHGGVGAALTGDGFIRNWSGVGLDRLVERVRSMPPDSPERLGDAAVFDLVAYILSANGFPAGASELETQGIDRIRIEGRGGSDEIPNFSLVAIVGCLARTSEREWIVTRAVEPVRTKNPNASAGDGQGSQGSPASSMPGTRIYKLLNVYPSPDRLDGHMVETKGFLIRGPVDSVNVTALTSLATVCPR
jgi:mono/diheme cytochrome c family protein